MELMVPDEGVGLDEAETEASEPPSAWLPDAKPVRLRLGEGQGLPAVTAWLRCRQELASSTATLTP